MMREWIRQVHMEPILPKCDEGYVSDSTASDQTRPEEPSASCVCSGRFLLPLPAEQGHPVVHTGGRATLGRSRLGPSLSWLGTIR